MKKIANFFCAIIAVLASSSATAADDLTLKLPKVVTPEWAATAYPYLDYNFEIFVNDGRIKRYVVTPSAPWAVSNRIGQLEGSLTGDGISSGSYNISGAGLSFVLWFGPDGVLICNGQGFDTAYGVGLLDNTRWPGRTVVPCSYQNELGLSAINVRLQFIKRT